jgi:hypothetical protein
MALDDAVKLIAEAIAPISVEPDSTADAWSHLQFLGDDTREVFFPDEETGTGWLGIM